MAITKKQLSDEIHQAGFPLAKRQIVQDIAWHGIEQFREYSRRKYYSHTGKVIQKPLSSHQTSQGRYNQVDARTILISALARAWMMGFDSQPTLNHKHDYDSPFAKLAIRVFGHEGIGKPHEHLEEYWSIRKAEWQKNEINLKNGDFQGGVST
jgi:hypothetical protein